MGPGCPGVTPTGGICTACRPHLSQTWDKKGGEWRLWQKESNHLKNVNNQKAASNVAHFCLYAVIYRQYFKNISLKVC